MRTLKLCLTALGIVFLTFTAYSQKHSALAGRDPIIDSLRKAGIPEADLASYSRYLFDKKNARTHPTHTIMQVDSTTSCYNPDFELGNLTNWTGYTGNCCPITTSFPGIVLGRHTITSGTGTDPWSQGDIPVVAPGGGDYSVRLGNDNVGSEAEKLVHKFIVTPQTTSFTYQYAVVLEDPEHEPSAQPRFEVKVFDGNGVLLPCGYYQVTAAGTIPGFISVGDIRYKKWTTVGVDLSAYVGQYITIEFTTGDCGYGGHFGYAYIDATCEPLKIRKKFCLGDSTATLIAPDGFEAYNWSTGHTTQSITINHPQNGDTIWAYLTSVTGCPTSLYAVLIQEEAPTTVSAWSDTLICPGDTVHLHATGSTEYAWTISGATDTIFTIPDPVVNPMHTTNYVATVYNACGYLQDSVLVQVKPYTPLIAVADTEICLGLSTPLLATGNANCTWTPANGLSCVNCTNPTATPTQTTMYYVTAIDTTSGCLLRDSVKVKVDSSVVNVYAGADQNLCAGSTLYLGSSASGASSYSWTHTEPISCDTCLDVLVNPAVTTNYILHGFNKCASDVDTVTITVFPLPMADAGPHLSVCYGDTVVLGGSGGTLGTDYQWSPPQNLSCANCDSPTYVVTHSELFYLSVHNAGGCYSNDTVTVTIRSLFHSTTADQSICEGQSVTLTAVDDSTRPLIWFPDTALSCDTCAVTIATPTSSIIYYVVGEDSTSCKGVDGILITVVPLPVANAGPDRDLCIGEYVYLTGSGGATYQWYPTQDLSCPACNNPQANPDTTIAYNLIATNMCGSDTDQVVVNVHTLPPVVASADQQICVGLGTSVSANGASTYQWSPSTNLSCVYCANPAVLTVGGSDITYTVTGTDAFGCSASDDVLIHALILPTINAGNDSTICIGTSATLHPSGQLNQATWTSAATLSCSVCSNPVATPTSTITYTVEVIDPLNNCHNTDNVTISVTQLPVAVVSGSQTICNGSNVPVNASGGPQYAWSPAAGLSCTTCSAPVAAPTQTTNYTVVVSNECGSDQDQVLVNVLSNIPVVASPDQAGCIGDHFNLTATGGNTGVTYLWLPTTGLSCSNCANPSIPAATSSITYTLTALNTNSCSTSDSVRITVDVQPVLAIDVVYAPDCDGLNASFVNAGPAAQTYAWDFGDGSSSALPAPSHNYVNPGQGYLVQLIASNGACSSKDTMTTDKFDLAHQLVIPNIFTPNGDNTNDCFEIGVNNVYAGNLLNCGTIDIFNRWGLKVFSGSLSKCWNGLKDNSGNALPDGTYYYIIDNKQQQNRGFITLAR